MVVVTYLWSIVHDGGEVIRTRLGGCVLTVELSHVLTHIVPRDVYIRISVEPEVRALRLSCLNLERIFFSEY